MEKLSSNEEEALLIIADNRLEVVSAEVIHTLLEKGYITISILTAGWQTTSKGRAYLRSNKI